MDGDMEITLRSDHAGFDAAISMLERIAEKEGIGFGHKASE
jgi:hypothetical protein